MNRLEILKEYLRDVEDLSMSENYHDAENFTMKYGGLEDKTFLNEIRQIIKEIENAKTKKS